jgi:hypothetical protein
MACGKNSEGRAMTSEEKVQEMSKRITTLICDDEWVQNWCIEIATAECKRFYDHDTAFLASDGMTTRMWDIDTATTEIHPSENHYWGIYNEAMMKAMHISLMNLRHFSDDPEPEDM